MTLTLPRMERTDILEHEGLLLRLEREWDDGTLLLTRVRTDRRFLLDDDEPPTRSWFLTEWSAGRLRLVSNKVTSLQDPCTKAQDPSGFGKQRLEDARRVQFVLIELDRRACSNSNRAIGRHLAEIYTQEVIDKYGIAPPPPTARKWRKRGSIGNRTIVNLRQNNKKVPYKL